MKVANLLHVKGSDVVTIGPDATVGELVKLLADHNVGAVVVADDAGAVAGIVSERDVVRGLTTSTGLLGEPVGSIMKSEVHTCTPASAVDEIMVLMTQRRIRHVPVLDDSGSLTGIISVGDVVKSRIQDLEFEREQLSSYLNQ